MIVGALEDRDHDARASAQEMTDAEVVELPGLGHVGAWPSPRNSPYRTLDASSRRDSAPVSPNHGVRPRPPRRPRARHRRPLRVALPCLLGMTLGSASEAASGPKSPPLPEDLASSGLTHADIGI
jgi:hypothetical protein